MESNINIEVVHGGFVLTRDVADKGSRTEVFTSTGKLMKALRGAIEELSLLPKKAEADAE